MLRLRGLLPLRPLVAAALLAGSVTIAPALAAAPSASAATVAAPAVAQVPESNVAARIDDETPTLSAVPDGTGTPSAADSPAGANTPSGTGGSGSTNSSASSSTTTSSSTTSTTAAPAAPPAAFDEEASVDSQQAGLSALATSPGRLTTRAVDIAPFTLVGISGFVAEGDALVRAHVDGSWSAWAPLEFDVADTPDASSPSADQGGSPIPTSEGVWFGTSDGYELSLPAGSTGVTVHLAREYTQSASTPQEAPSDPLDPLAISGRPPINPRSSWGARPPKEPYSYADTVTHAVVHHSVSQNAYSPGDVPSILRSIQAYHMDANGWNDIAYNFAVDKYGTLWEARGGGMTRPVIGGHSRGANTRTTGVVALGDFSTAGAPTGMVNSIGDLLGWKLAIHGVDPSGSGPFQILTTDKYAEGTVVNFRSIIGHRDVNATGCPGNYLYARLDEIRNRARAKWAEMTFIAYQTNRLGGGYAEVAPQYQAMSGLRVFCDWNGDGVDTPAAVRGGVWFVTDDPSGGPPTRWFGYGNPSDIPVCGDWNGDGVDTAGIVRNGAWYLTNGVGAPFADIVLGYGDPGDIPVAGDWNGDGTDSIGIVRNGAWYITNALTTGVATTVLAYGDPNDIPVVGDWDGDGIDSLGILRNGYWYLTNSVATGIATMTFPYGDADDVGAAGDWNGDGKDSPAVIRFP